MIKLGLVPYGKITEPKEDDPTLTFNTLGRHVSRMVYTRVTSVKSPWMAGVNAGDIFTVPVSHGEGRFVADDKALRKLIENGQVATQYVDADGTVSGRHPVEPQRLCVRHRGHHQPRRPCAGQDGPLRAQGHGFVTRMSPARRTSCCSRAALKYFK